MCTERFFRRSANLKSVMGQNKHYISISVISVFCSTHFRPLSYPPPSSCLIKTLTVDAGAIIHVIGEDNPVISLWCLQPGDNAPLNNFSDGYIYLCEKWNSSTKPRNWFGAWENWHTCQIRYHDCMKFEFNPCQSKTVSPPPGSALHHQCKQTDIMINVSNVQSAG